ncbi:MAG: hypothetical protein AABW48_05750 [Nanoarchaeota archaeon]
MKRNLTILVCVLIVLVISGIAYAANEKNAETEVATDAAAEEPAKTPTYGQCVSENAVVKNSCYATVKETLKTCKTQAAENATPKDATKQCKQTYKKDLKQCKVVFKASKKECAKIKHNVFETMGSAFK